MGYKQQPSKEDKRIISIQMELFPSANEKDMKKGLAILKSYPELKIVVDDYNNHKEEIINTIHEGEIARRIEADELYANKTANAILLAQNQKSAAEECELLQKSIERAVNLIRNEEAKTAVTCRYIKGYTYSETLLFMHRGDKSATIDRRLGLGIASVVNTLKMWGLLDQKVRVI